MKIDVDNFAMLQSKIGCEEINDIIATFCALMEKYKVPLDEIESVLKLVNQMYEAKKFGIFTAVIETKEKCNKRKCKFKLF
jgi:hypothetical protein